MNGACGGNSPVATLITLIYQGFVRLDMKLCFDVEAIFHVFYVCGACYLADGLKENLSPS